MAGLVYGLFVVANLTSGWTDQNNVTHAWTEGIFKDGRFPQIKHITTSPELLRHLNPGHIVKIKSTRSTFEDAENEIQSTFEDRQASTLNYTRPDAAVAEPRDPKYNFPWPFKTNSYNQLYHPDYENMTKPEILALFFPWAEPGLNKKQAKVAFKALQIKPRSTMANLLYELVNVNDRNLEKVKAREGEKDLYLRKLLTRKEESYKKFNVVYTV
jgi:hypothetical protein